MADLVYWERDAEDY